MKIMQKAIAVRSQPAVRTALAAFAAVAAATLAGCATDRVQRLGDALHARPVLTVRQGVISVSPEPVTVYLSTAKDPIVWRLPGGFSFPADGITILGQVVDAQGRGVPPNERALKDPGLRVQPEGRTAFACRLNESNRQEFACEPVKGRAAVGVYRYAIRVIDKDGKRIEWDPNIFAMD
ncbi:MAG: hypothetical protein KIT17_18860 [Rubrivivax sp.]|nr:hypothetical protein [Rubrivivax sp.]